MSFNDFQEFDVKFYQESLVLTKVDLRVASAVHQAAFVFITLNSTKRAIASMLGWWCNPAAGSVLMAIAVILSALKITEK